MAEKEAKVRLQLRARAWDALAALPDGLELAGQIEESAEAGDWVVTVTIRRKGARAAGQPGPPPAAALPLEPLQRWLPGCWLTDCERAVVAELASRTDRRTMAQLRDATGDRLGRAVAEGLMKALLARMADRTVGILSQDRSARPPGYQLTAGYRDFLVWLPLARRACEEATSSSSSGEQQVA